VCKRKADREDIAAGLISCALYLVLLIALAAAIGTGAAVENSGAGGAGHAPKGEIVKRMMALGFFMWFIVMALLSLAACADLPPKTESLVWTLYVASPENGGDDANSGRSYEPLATIEAALKKIAEMKMPSETAVISIRGGITGNVLIEDRSEVCPPIILCGLSGRYPGTIYGTLTVGQGANITIKEDLIVTGIGRGIVVAGGSLTLDGGVVAENISQEDGAGVYVEDGVFVMNSGNVRDNTSVKGGGGGVYVQSGDFVMRGGKIRDNVSSSGGINGRAGGGVYVNADTGATFAKVGGVISDNRARHGYKGTQVHVQAGHGSKSRDRPVEAAINLYSDDDLNWDNYRYRY
jgi:hypothetical protein